MNIITIPLDRWRGHSPEYKYDERALPIRYIVLHSTDGVDSRAWLSEWNRKHETAQNDVSTHYLIQRDGAIYRIIADEKRAWHVGVAEMPNGETDGNSCAIGIELEHLNESNYADAQMNSASELVLYLMHRYGITRDRVVTHASIARPIGRKKDPVHFDMTIFLTEPVPKPIPTLFYSAQSETLATPDIDTVKLIEYLVHKHDYKQYTQADVRLILGYYTKYSAAIGMDCMLGITQMIYETGWLESWWSARPRRNPAGIGVSGQTTSKNPGDDVWWAQAGKIWRRGQSFTSWDLSVQHHLARLLLYARTDNELTPAQLAFTAICRDKAKLDRIRGKSGYWSGLNGTWAVPGHGYAEKLATIANGFIKASQ